MARGHTARRAQAEQVRVDTEPGAAPLKQTVASSGWRQLRSGTLTLGVPKPRGHRQHWEASVGF